ncbi:MAG: VWA domain-containing protein [Pseudomonadota bacterium]
MSDERDIDLTALKGLNAPKVSEPARMAALNVAMGAFDDVQIEKAHLDNKKRQDTQENGEAARPRGDRFSFWSSPMTVVSNSLSRLRLSSATPVAGLLVLPIATMSALHFYGVLDPQDAVAPPVPVANETTVADRANGQKALNQDGAISVPGTPSSEILQGAEVGTKPTVRPRPDPSKRVRPAVSPQPFDQLQRDASPNAVQKRARSVRSFSSNQASGQLRMAPAIGRARSRIAPQMSTDKNTRFEDGRVLSVADNPVSTFSADVDTAAYARVRRSLLDGILPSRDVVRVEEMINYFDYDYPVPESREAPFKPTITVMPTPWSAGTQLMHVGIKGFDVPQEERPRANLVFLLDVSGSMRGPDRLPLLVKSFRLLLQKLQADDTISIVTYAGAAGTVLKPTKVSDRATIFAALDRLQAGGGTAGAAGIEQAYALAAQNFVEGGLNRVMLATDGDFNVGISDPDALKQFIGKKRDTGIYLSIFGFGKGNTNDALMQSLAQNGNGQASYIDTLAEAQKVLVEQAGGTLFPIATDVKFQMEFNPAAIAEYRLIGYETRALKREDFNNDTVDAGDIGSGHSVTAIYEITPVGSNAVLNSPLRYGDRQQAAQTSTDISGEIGFLKMRYKLPGETKSKLVEQAVMAGQVQDFDKVAADVRFSVAVAAFGQKLRGQSALRDFDFESINGMAMGARGEDGAGHRSEFSKLVRLAASLTAATAVTKPTSESKSD